MSQRELATEAGIAVSVLQAIEQGRSDPRNSTLIALVDALRARGVELVPETDRVAWGAVALRGSKAEDEGRIRPESGPSEASKS